jgi:hypothetical protein
VAPVTSTQNPICSENGFQRERTRATFAVGAIALAYYLKQLTGTEIWISVIPLGLENSFPQVKPAMINATIWMATTFGAYILAMAVALSNDIIRSSYWEEFCQMAQAFGKGSYLVGVALLAAVGGYFFGSVAVVIGVLTLLGKLIEFVLNALRQK